MKRVDWSNLQDALQEVDAWADAYPAETVLALWEARAWEMLDFRSWEALCASRGWTKVSLPAVERRETVGELRQAGMSTRAIAAATGVSDITVRRDLGASNVAPEPVRGTDGKTYQPTQPVRVNVTVEEAPDPEPVVVPVVVIPEDRPAEVVTVLTEDDWRDANGFEQASTEPDPDDFLPVQSKFERGFWQHLRQAQELAKDLDYPQHFTEPMHQMVADVIETLTRKQTAMSGRGLRVVNGGKA